MTTLRFVLRGGDEEGVSGAIHELTVEVEDGHPVEIIPSLLNAAEAAIKAQAGHYDRRLQISRGDS